MKNNIPLFATLLKPNGGAANEIGRCRRVGYNIITKNNVSESFKSCKRSWAGTFEFSFYILLRTISLRSIKKNMKEIHRPATNENDFAMQNTMQKSTTESFLKGEKINS